jgi:hypothetical protein
MQEGAFFKLQRKFDKRLLTNLGCVAFWRIFSQFSAPFRGVIYAMLILSPLEWSGKLVQNVPQIDRNQIR